MVAPFRSEFVFAGAVTAAGLTALPGPISGSPTCYVDEFDATYRWTLGSAIAIDNFRVLGHTGGSAGRWILDGDRITLSPRGGVLDDWAVGVGFNIVGLAGDTSLINYEIG